MKACTYMHVYVRAIEWYMHNTNVTKIKQEGEEIRMKV